MSQGLTYKGYLNCTLRWRVKSVPLGAPSLSPVPEPTRDPSCHIHSPFPIHSGTTSHHGGTQMIYYHCNLQCCLLSLLHKVCKLMGECWVHSHPKDPHFRLRQFGSVTWMLQGLWKSSEISFFYSEFILPNLTRVSLSPPRPPPCT